MNYFSFLLYYIFFQIYPSLYLYLSSQTIVALFFSSQISQWHSSFKQKRKKEMIKLQTLNSPIINLNEK